MRFSVLLGPFPRAMHPHSWKNLLRYDDRAGDRLRCPWCRGRGFASLEGARRYPCPDCGGSGTLPLDDEEEYADDEEAEWFEEMEDADGEGRAS